MEGCGRVRWVDGSEVGRCVWGVVFCGVTGVMMWRSGDELVGK